MVPVHVRPPLSLPCTLLHGRTAPPDGVPVDSLLAVSLSSLLRLYLQSCFPSQCPAQTFSHPSARNHGGYDEILLSGRGGGQRAQTALCRPGIHGSIFRLPQAPCL